MEIWKDVPGYEGYYQASNIGRIKSLNRVIKRGNSTMKLKERILKQRINQNGYCVVPLQINSKKKIFKVHQLVAMAFLNHAPCGMLRVVDHVDNNKTNNLLENLQILSTRENNVKSIKQSTSKYTGVSWSSSSGKWRAAIKHKGRWYHLGLFMCEKQASFAYKIALFNIKSGLY